MITVATIFFPFKYMQGGKKASFIENALHEAVKNY